MIGVTAAFLITSLITAFLPDLNSWWDTIFPYEYFGTALLAFLLLVGMGFIPNYWIDEENKIKNIIREDNDGIETILLKAGYFGDHCATHFGGCCASRFGDHCAI